MRPAGCKMSRPRDGRNERGVEQNEGHLSVFTNAHAALVHQTRLLSAYKKDPHHGKVYLAAREYFSAEGQTFVPPLVGKIKRHMNTDPTLSSHYPSCLGLPSFTCGAAEFTLGRNSAAIQENRVLCVQTANCTAAVRLGAELLRHWYQPDPSKAWSGPVYLSSPCDDSLAAIFQAAGIEDIREYSYWSDAWWGVRVEKLLEDLGGAPERSVVVLSASAHYPTGADLSQQDWRRVAKLMMRRRLFPFLLLPSLGLCFGDLGRDAWPVQLCASLGMELLCAQSFSHCFGLYGEAVGLLLCVLKQNSLLLGLQTLAEKIVRSLWAQPDVGGARVIAAVLNNPAHLFEWRGELRRVVRRCMLVREVLREKLRLLGCPGRWDHLTLQSGLYSCTGLSAQQVAFLSKQRHVYLLANGCFNVSMINGRNLDYVAQSIHAALTAQGSV